MTAFSRYSIFLILFFYLFLPFNFTLGAMNIPVSNNVNEEKKKIKNSLKRQSHPMQNAEIQSDSAVLDEHEKYVEFTQNVNLQAYGTSLRADNIRIFYLPKFTSIEKIHINGNITCQHEDWLLTSKNAKITRSGAKFYVDNFNIDKKNFSFYQSNTITVFAKQFNAFFKNKKVHKFTATDKVHILHDGAIITAGFAVFCTDKKIVTMHSNVAILDKKNNIIKCDKCKINLVSRVYKINGAIKGEISL